MKVDSQSPQLNIHLYEECAGAGNVTRKKSAIKEIILMEVFFSLD